MLVRISGLFLILGALLHAEVGRKPSWQAQWIFTHQWGKESPPYDPTNLFVIFRKTFDLPSGVTSADAYMFADPRYQLFVNGRRVGRGPVRSETYWFYYDQYDLRPYLRMGRNAVAVLVNTFGDHGLGWYIPPPESPVRGALLFQAEMQLAGGSKMVIVSDPSWRFRRHDAWQQNTPRVSDRVPHIEIYDARLEPTGWDTADYEDSSWTSAVALRSPTGRSKPPMEPYVHLLPRPIPPLIEEEVLPEKVFRAGETDSRDTPVGELAERTVTEPHYRPEQFALRDLDKLKRGQIVIEPKTRAPAESRAPFVIVDFGKQVAGFLRLNLDAPAGTVIDIAFSESLKDGHVHATSPEGKYVARYIAREGPQLWERFDWYGFQYVQFTFRNFDRPIRFATSLNFNTFPPGKIAFRSSDELLNRIWDVARYTLQLCTWDRFIDVTQREQRQWLGDGQLETVAHYALHGDLSIVTKFLRDGARSQRAHGLLPAYNAGASAGILLDYNFSWLDAVATHYLYTGDLDLLHELYPSFAKCLDWFVAAAGENGVLGILPYQLFLDFSGPDRRGTSSILNARYYYTLNEGVRLAGVVGDPHHAEVWKRAAARVRESFDRLFWDDERSAYVDASIAGERSPYLGQFANGMAILGGLASEDRIKRMLPVVFDPQRATVTSEVGHRYQWRSEAPPRPEGFNVRTDVSVPQPHGEHFVLLALAKVGRYDLMLDAIKQLWGGLLQQGATAFWGDWDPLNTLAAGWSSTPAYHFATTLLGIRPVEPGFRTFAVEPRPAGLSWAKGSFPSVRGEIPVSWQLDGTGFRLEGLVPQGTRAQVLIPASGPRKPRVVRLGGADIWRQGKTVPHNAVDRVAEEEDGVRIFLRRDGRYEFAAIY